MGKIRGFRFVARTAATEKKEGGGGREKNPRGGRLRGIIYIFPRRRDINRELVNARASRNIMRHQPR